MEYSDHYQELFGAVEYSKRHDSITATCTWPEGTLSGETYTIDASPTISLELDKYFPVRPIHIRLTEISEPSFLLIENIGGSALREAFESAPVNGLSLFSSELTQDNRFTIACIQAASPSTPPIVRQACRLLLQQSAEAAHISYGDGGGAE